MYNVQQKQTEAADIFDMWALKRTRTAESDMSNMWARK